MPSSSRGGSAAAEDSILPMTLVQLEYPSQHEAVALETLYQTAAQTPWVVRLGDAPGVPQATDLETALQHGQAGRWTRGLLVQASVMEALGLSDSASLLHPEQLAQGLIRAFAQYVQTKRIHPCKSAPKHGPDLYLQIWTCIEEFGEKGFPDAFETVQYGGVHPGLVNQVPRKRRSGAANCQEAQPPCKAARNMSDSTSIFESHSGGLAPTPTDGGLDGLHELHQENRQNHSLMAMQQQLHQHEQPHQQKNPHHPQHTYMHARYDAVVDVAPTFFKEEGGLHAIAEASQGYYGEVQPDSVGQSHTQTNGSAHVAGGSVGEHACHHPGHVQHDGTPGIVGVHGLSVQQDGIHRPSTLTNETPTPEELAQYDTLEKLQSVFHKPINDAAAALGMGVTVLKKLCRDRGIQRWPYRKLSSVDKLIESVKAVLQEDPNDDATKEAYHSLINLRNTIFEDPGQDLNEWAKKLRQANFKQQYKMRQTGPSHSYFDSGF